MADPQAARLTQLRNIQTKTGRTIAELHAVLTASGLVKTGERRTLLMERFQLGYGDANSVALTYGQPLPVLDAVSTPNATSAATADPLDAIYAGAKADLRPLHETVMAFVHRLGDFEQAPKKTYMSLRRKRQFAMIGPATKDFIEIGLNAKDLPPHARLKPHPPGGMCQATTRIGSAKELDALLKGWIKQAYDAAG
ncbi:MAG: DUF4287 domain-containing protein [Rhodocyclaceae bacterium]|nr:MAG: DUF4287 domain-containing protein [Rhodocyclaceae bacterium]